MRRFQAAWKTMVAAVVIMGSANLGCPQSLTRNFRTLLTRECSMVGDQLARIGNREIVVNPLRSQDKKEIAVCGVVHLDLNDPPTLVGLTNGLSQRSNRAIHASGRFSKPPNTDDLRSLTLEKSDLEALRECRPGKCSVLVSNKLLQTLGDSPNMSKSELEALYAQDLTDLARNFSERGIDALTAFGGLGVRTPFSAQNRALIRHAPLLMKLDPALFRYIDEYPGSVLAGAETTLSWSKIDFGLKPIVTITSTTTYAKADGLPAVVTQQIYASRYMNGSIAVAAVVFDETGGYYLIFADISRSDALGGLFSGIKRSIASGEGVERVKALLETAKWRLEAPPASTDNTTKQEATVDEDRVTWTGWFNTTALIAAAGILVLIAVGMRSYLRGAHRPGTRGTGPQAGANRP